MMKVLVATSSRYGTTAEIGDRIAAVLRNRFAGTWIEVDVHSLDRVRDPARYDAVVLGSAVNMGRWVQAAHAFATANVERLRTMPTWLFSCRPLVGPSGGGCADGDHIRKLLNARDHQVFAGPIGRVTSGDDCWDWDRIDVWAAAIADQLQAFHTSRDESQPIGA